MTMKDSACLRQHFKFFSSVPVPQWNETLGMRMSEQALQCGSISIFRTRHQQQQHAIFSNKTPLDNE